MYTNVTKINQFLWAKSPSEPLDDGQPTHAAVLLFGKEPQRFVPASAIKCAHFHGTEVAKPIPSFQVFKGALFALVDQAVDFVMSKLALSVGTRAESAQVPVAYEIPREVVSEGIVNATPIAITPATAASRSCSSPTAWRSGIPAGSPPLKY